MSILMQRSSDVNVPSYGSLGPQSQPKRQFDQISCFAPFTVVNEQQTDRQTEGQTNTHTDKIYDAMCDICIHRRQRRDRDRDPPLFDLQGSSCVVLTTPNILKLVNLLTVIYSKFVETWTCQSVSFVRHKLVLLLKFIIQLQSMGHVNLKNNTPRMHHITILRRKIHSPSPLPSPPTAPRFSRLRRSTCDPPMFQWR